MSSSTGPRTRSQTRKEAERRAQSVQTPALDVIHEESVATHGHPSLNNGNTARRGRDRKSQSLRSPFDQQSTTGNVTHPQTGGTPITSSTHQPSNNRAKANPSQSFSPSRVRSPRPPSPIPSPTTRTPSSPQPGNNLLLKAVEARDLKSLKRHGLKRNFTPAQAIDRAPHTPEAPKRDRNSQFYGRVAPLGMVQELSEDATEEAVFGEVGEVVKPPSPVRLPRRQLEFLNENGRPDYRQTKSSAI